MEFYRRSLQILLIPCSDIPFLMQELFRLLQLGKTDCRTDIRHTIIVPNDIVPILTELRHPLILEMRCTSIERFIIRHDHTAFSSRNGLIAIKAERRYVAERTDVLPRKIAAESLRAILHYKEIMLLGDRHDTLHITGMTIEMHHHDRLRLLRDLTLDVIWIHLPVTLERINKNRRCLRVGNRIDRCHIGQRRHNHLIAASNAQSDQRQMKRHRPIRNRNRMICSNILCKCSFKLLDKLSLCRDPARIQALIDIFLLIAGQRRLINRNELHGYPSYYKSLP